MSNKLMTLVWDNESGNLNYTETALLVKLADFSSDDGTGIWPSINTLVKKTKICRSTVITTKQSLCDKNYLCQRERSKDGRQTSNEYFINAKKLWDEANKEAPTAPFTDLFKEEEGSPSHTPPQSVTHTPPVRHTHPNPSLTALYPSSSSSGKIQEQERAAAAARIAALQEAEAEKLKSRPRPEPGAEFIYEPTPLYPVADEDKRLSEDLSEEGVSKGTILALLRAYPNRAHIRQSLSKMKEVIKTKGVKSPDGFMRHLMNDPYEEAQPKKRAPKVNVNELEGQKIIQASIEREKQLKANLDNPEHIQGHIQAARDALKQGRRVAMTSH